MKLLIPAVLLAAVAVGSAAEPQLPTAKPVGKLELVAAFDGPMPTGVTVTRKGRVFVNYPRWGDPVTFTVAEVKDGKATAYPNAEFATFDKAKPGETLVSVQSVVVDPADRLWLLDTGSVEFGPVIPGDAKLVGVDLATNAVVKTIAFPPEVALKTTYLNDIRFDLRKGKAGGRVHHRLVGRGAERHHRGGLGRRDEPAAAARPPVHEGGEGVPARRRGPATDGTETGGTAEAPGAGVGRDRHRARRQAPVLLPAGKPAPVPRPDRRASRREDGGRAGG